MPEDRILGRMVGDLIAGSIGEGVRLWRWGRAVSARNRAVADARAGDRQARRQRRQWFDLVERQRVRGHAGNATQEEARAALRGRGGRPNPLDDRWF
jgi:hypothetical protein